MQKHESFGLREKDIDEITGILQAYGMVEKVVIFGSRAKGNHRRGSDVDLALFGSVDERTATQIAYRLNEETMMPYHFDVLVYDRIAGEKLKAHIDRVGRELYVKNPEKEVV